MSKTDWRSGRIFLWWASVVACLIGVISASTRLGVGLIAALGALFLIAAAIEHHWHRAPVPVGTPIRTLFVVTACCLPFLALAYEVWPESSVSIAAAQISVTKIEGLFVINQQTGQQGFGLNIHHRNSGQLPTLKSSHRAFAYVAPVTSLPTSYQIEGFQRMARQGQLVTSADSSNEIEPNSGDFYFSYPDSDGDIVGIANAAKQVIAGQQRMYVFVAFRYVDSSLSPGKMRLTEICRWAQGNFEAWHVCGVNRTTVVEDVVPS